MPENPFAPTDFSTDFMDDPSATEDRHTKKYHSLPTTWLYGLVGAEDWAPSWIKEGYNRSIEGQAYEWLHGKPYFNKSQYQNQGMVNDILATVMSFATVTDFATLGAGSMIGKAAMGKLMAKSGNLAVKAGVGKKTAQIGAQEGAEQFLFLQNKIGLGKTMGLAATGAAPTLGFYEGIHSATAMLADDKKDFEFLEVLKGGARGAVTGAVIGASGAGFAGSKTISKIPGLGSMKATGPLSRATAGEVTSVGLLPAAEATLTGDPRLPTGEDFIHAAGLVGGLKIQNYLGGKAFKGIKKASGKYDYVDAANKFTPEQVKAEKEKIAKAELESGKELERSREEFVNQDGTIQVKPTDPNWRETTRNTETFDGVNRKSLLGKAHQLQEAMGISKEKAKKIKQDLFGKDSLGKVKDSQVVDYINHIKNNYIEFEFIKSSDATQKGTKTSMKVGDFFRNFSRQSQEKWLSPDTSKNRKTEIKQASKSLGESSKDLKANLEKLGYKDLNKAKPEDLIRIKDHYNDRLIIDTFVKDMSSDKSIRMHMVEMTPDGVLKNGLNKNLYGIVSRQLGALKKSIGLSHWGQLGINKINNADFQHTYWNARMAQAMQTNGISKLTKQQAENLTLLMTTMDGSGITREFAGSGKNRKQTTRTITDANGKKKKIYNVKGKDGKYINLDIGQASPRNVKKIMDYMYEKLKRSGIPVKERLPNYMPQLFKVEKLEKMLDGIWKLHEDYSGGVLGKPNFGNEMMARNPATKKQIGDFLKNLMEKGNEKGEGVMTEAGRQVPPELVRFLRAFARSKNEKIPDYYYAWNIAKDNLFVEKTAVAPHVEKSRRLEIPESLKNEFLERDARALLLRYTNQFSKRLSFSQEFGLKGERMHALTDKLKNKPLEQEALNRSYQAFTGMIDFNPNYNYTKTWKNFYQNTTNFMVATKIGLGFATIPNITQPFISTAVKHGYWPMIKGWYRMKFDKPFQKRLLNNVGQNNTDMMKLMFGLDMNDVGLMAKFAERTTQLGFNQINRFNYMLSAATMNEKLLQLQKHAQGKGLGISKPVRERAVRELRKYGFKNINENLDFKGASPKTRTKIMKSMHEFARDSQLQKNVLNDPFMASNPKVRPFMLFKRFGIRQASWMGETLSKEIFRYKNPLPVLRLVAGGAAGGMFVSSAKEMMADFFSNEDVFNDNYTVSKIWDDIKDGDVKEIVEKVTFRDIGEAFGASGMLGVVTDIISSEDKLNAIEFLATPAIAMDGMRIWDTFTSVLTESKEFGIDHAIRRAAKKGLPLLGTVPKTILTRRLETNRQKVDYYTRRKTFVKNNIIDSMIRGNKTKAIRLIKEWNEVIVTSDVWKFSPGIIMDYEDIGPDAIVNRIINRVLKMNDIPQSMAKYLK
tara:strand:+ start:3792 stop:7934 length:4143 start_codon:yes stop_codon:yes gene_type:complete